MINFGLQSSCKVSISCRLLNLNVAHALINTQVEISDLDLDFCDDAHEECKEAFKKLCEKGKWARPFELTLPGLPDGPYGSNSPNYLVNKKELLSSLINERLKIRRLEISCGSHDFPQQVFHEMLSKGIFESDDFDLRLFNFSWKGADFLAFLAKARIKFATFYLREHCDQDELDLLPLIASDAFNACKRICFPKKTKSLDAVLKAIASAPIQELEFHIENDDDFSKEAFIELFLDEQNFKYLKVLNFHKYNGAFDLFRKIIQVIRPKLIILETAVEDEKVMQDFEP